MQLLAAYGAADILDLEPVDVAERLARLGQGVAHGLMNALIRNADYIHDLVSLVRHGLASVPFTDVVRRTPISLRQPDDCKSADLVAEAQGDGQSGGIFDRRQIEHAGVAGDAADYLGAAEGACDLERGPGRMRDAERAGFEARRRLGAGSDLRRRHYNLDVKCGSEALDENIP